MELHELDDLLPKLGVEPTKADLDYLWGVFQEDFVHRPFKVNGKNVKVVLKSSSTRGYECYAETFVHLITRKSNTGDRVFDRHRANKLHWIKCILENRAEDEIEFFKYPEADGALRHYYWYKEGDFLVIMEEILPDYLVITSFHIDDRRNREYFEKKLRWSRQNTR